MTVRPTRLLHPAVVVERKWEPYKPRRLYRLGTGCPSSRIGVLNNSIVNLERGLLERVFFCKDDGVNFAPPTEPHPGLFWERMLPFRRRLWRRVPPTTPLSPTQFADCYRGRKHTIYMNAVKSLEMEPISQKDAELKTFTKAEKGDFEAKPDPTPRVIQPRDPRYNVAVGTYLKPMEHNIYKAIDRVFGYTTVTKGMDFYEVADLIRSHWQEFHDPVAVMADANRFDQHVSETALRWEHSVYLGAVGHDERAVLGRLLSWQITNSGRGMCPDGRVRYKVRGKRASGDMNTAMGNVLLMCGMVWAYCRDRQVKIRLVNNGDDSVFILERKDLQRFSHGLEEWFLQMGFSMAVSAPVSSVHQIKFCQAHPVFDGSRWVMCRDPAVALAKDSHSLIMWPNSKAYDKWRFSVSDCGLAIAGSLPVFDAFYRALGRGTSSGMGHHPGLEGGLYFAALAMREPRKTGQPTIDARVSFWEAFGITPAEQIATEKYYDSLDLSWRDLAICEAEPGDPIYSRGCIQLPL